MTSNLRGTDDIFALAEGDGDRFREIIKMDAEWRVLIHKSATIPELKKAVGFLVRTYVANAFKARWRKGFPKEVGAYWQRMHARAPRTIIEIRDLGSDEYFILGGEHSVQVSEADKLTEYARIPDPEGVP